MDTNLSQYIVYDFYHKIKENEIILNYPHFRSLSVIDNFNTIICSAILEKPKNKKKWRYIIYWWGIKKMIIEIKYVKPFRATEKNRILFNKKSRHLAKKVLVQLDNSNTAQ